jgi:hypothetical protein
MAYCPPELLADLADLLAEVRTWAWVVEMVKLHRTRGDARFRLLQFA